MLRRGLLFIVLFFNVLDKLILDLGVAVNFVATGVETWVIYGLGIPPQLIFTWVVLIEFFDDF